MNEEHRSLLNRHRSELVRDMRNVEPLLDLLISSSVFSANDDDIQDIRTQETPLDRARALLDLLQSRGPDAYQYFLHALRAVRPHLALLLEQSPDIEVPAASPESADCKFPQPTLPQLKTVRKLQRALRDHYLELARSTTLFDHQTHATSAGLDEVFVTLSAIKFDEYQSLFARQKKLSTRNILESASKTWCDRRTGEEITDLSRLFRFPDGQSARSCLLLGQAASGKTLTLYKVLSLWADGNEEFLKEFELVFYVSGRDKQALEGKSAVEVLQLCKFAGLDKTEEKQIASYLEENSEKVLILFDSVDEGGEKWGSNDGIQQIFQRRALGRCSFVLTGRPCLRAYEQIPRCVQRFHLVGLNDHHLNELLGRRLGDEEGKVLNAKLKQAEWTKLRALMKETPLLANMVAALAKESSSLPKTRTEVYTKMLLNLARRSQVKEGLSLPTYRQLNDLPAEVKQSLLRVGKVAVKGQREGQFVFDAQKDVAVLCGEAAYRLGLLKEFRTMSVLGDVHEAHFCHLTWQEYLAAYYVSEAEDVEKELLLCQEKIGFAEETLPFWQFVAGLLDVEKLTVLMRVLCNQETQSHETWRWLLVKMSCLAEAVQQPERISEEKNTTMSKIQEAASICLPRTVDFNSSVLNDGEVHSVAATLSCFPHVVDANLSSCNLTLSQLRVLNLAGGLQQLEALDCSVNNLNGERLTELRKGLRCNSKLQTLRLDWCNLNESDCLDLCQILTTKKSLQLVSLYCNPIGTKGHEALWSAVQESQLRWLNLDNTVQPTPGCLRSQMHRRVQFGDHMASVYMRGNCLSTEDAEQVVRAAQNSPCLSKLILSNNRIDNQIASVITSVFKQRAQSECLAAPLTICLHDNEVDKEALERLAKEMPVSSADCVECNMLLVSGGKVSQRDLSVHFKEYIQGGGKGDLNLLEKGIDASGAEQVAGKLRNNCIPVEALNMWGNSVGNQGAVCLARALSTNSTLRAMSLERNKVSSVGFEALSNTLTETNSTLQLLVMDGNPIFLMKKESHASDACKQLAKLLRTSHGLKVISLTDTGLGDDECVEMAEALVKNTTNIQFLDIAKNPISSAGVVALCHGLQKNTTIRFLELSENALGDDGLSAVFQCVEARSKSRHPLERVWIGDVCADVSHLAGVVIRSRFSYFSLTSVLNTYCAS